MTAHSSCEKTMHKDSIVTPKPWYEEYRESSLRIRCNAGDDIFYMPGIREIDQLKDISASVEGDFTISANVEVSGSSFADAAGFLLRVGNIWVKFCIEFDTKQNWRIVSIYSNPVSDESYGDVLVDGKAKLFLTREGRRIALWYSTKENNERKFVRTFYISNDIAVNLSCFTQAPFSEMTEAVFSSIHFSAEPMKDKR